MAGCSDWTCSGFNKYISASVSSWQGSWVGYGVCVRNREKEGGESVCVCVCVCVCVLVCFCLFLVDSAFTPLTLMHAAYYHMRCMRGCVHVVCRGLSVSLWQTLIIFNPGGISLKWKAAFQFYNPVDLISPPTPVHTVQLDGQDWPDESYSPQTHLHSLSLLCRNTGTPCRDSTALTFTKCCETVQCTKKLRCQPTCFHCSLGLLNGTLIRLWTCLCVCVCVCMWVCVWFDSAFVAPRSHPPPHTRCVQREKVLTTVKEEVALVKTLSRFILRGQSGAWKTQR